MPDIIDVANDQAQLILDKQIALAKSAKLDIYQNNSGKCWECDAPIRDKRRWCSPDCAKVAERSGW